jgi:hypothetical protein
VRSTTDNGLPFLDEVVVYTTKHNPQKTIP